MRQNYDPGRLRSEDLLVAVYGGSSREVRANLVSVRFLNQTVKFQKHLGAAAALEKVGQEILQEAAKDPALAKFILPFTSGRIPLADYTFDWRVVSGTERLSAHAFATAIDLDTGVGPMYWLWDARATDPVRAAHGEAGFKDVHFIPRGKLVMPAKIVNAFERNGFIWGGKWNHYDTMHFEFRPEFYPGYVISCPLD